AQIRAFLQRGAPPQRDPFCDTGTETRRKGCGVAGAAGCSVSAGAGTQPHALVGSNPKLGTDWAGRLEPGPSVEGGSAGGLKLVFRTTTLKIAASGRIQLDIKLTPCRANPSRTVVHRRPSAVGA